MHLNALSPVWVLSWNSCYFKWPVNLFPHFVNKNRFSSVWFSHFSLSQLILRSSCQTLYTLSFSTVRVLFWFFELFDKEKYCHIWCTWMPSLLCESSHEISPLEGSHVFLQATWLWEALATLLHYSKTVSLLCGPIMSLQFTRSWWAAHARYCAPIVSLL